MEYLEMDAVQLKVYFEPKQDQNQFINNNKQVLVMSSTMCELLVLK